MDGTYRIVNTLIDDLRRRDASTIPKLKIEIQLTKIKQMLLILEADATGKVRDLLLRLKSTFEAHPGDYERLLPFVTEVAEEFAKLAQTNGTPPDRRKGMDGPIMMRRKEDRF